MNLDGPEPPGSNPQLYLAFVRNQEAALLVARDDFNDFVI
jgi:hypothetical protein